MDKLLSNITVENLALFVSILALVVSGVAAYFTRAHNSLSVRPLLIFRSATYMIKGKIHLQIFNKGLGPLVFKYFNFEIDNKTFSGGTELFNYLGSLIDLTKDDLEDEYRSFTYPMHDLGMAANDEKTLIKLKVKKEKVNKAKELYQLLKKVEIKYQYEDFYGNLETRKYNYGRDFHGE